MSKTLPESWVELSSFGSDMLAAEISGDKVCVFRACKTNIEDVWLPYMQITLSLEEFRLLTRHVTAKTDNPHETWKKLMEL